MHSVFKYLILFIAFAQLSMALGQKCSIGGVKGICKHKKDCPKSTHFTDPNHCSDKSADIVCCAASGCQNNVAGTCLNTYNSCGGGTWMGGHCPGNDNVKCCHPRTPASHPPPPPPAPSCPKVKKVDGHLYYYSKHLTTSISNGINTGFDITALVCGVLPPPADVICGGAAGGVYVWKYKFNECSSKKKCFMLERNRFGIFVPHCSGDKYCC